MRREVLLGSATLAISVATFLAVSTHQLDLPGLYYDEAADAVPAMQLLLGQKLELVNNMGLTVGGLTLPVMVMDYVGAVSTYLLVPFFALFGIGTIPLRLMTVAAGALTIVLGYLVAKELFNRPVAAGTALLVAVNPSFVFWSRQGIHVSSIMTAITMGSWLAFLRWHRRGRVAHLYLGTFLLGLGLSTKVLFLWVILALGVTYLVVAPGRVLGLGRGQADGAPRRPMGLRPREGIASLICFLTGSSLILIYNLKTQGTIEVLFKNLRTTERGVNNFAFFENLATQLKAFATLLKGDHFWFLGGWFANDWYLPVFVGSLLVLGGLFMLKRDARLYLKSGLAVLLFIGIVLLESCFTVSILGPTHLLVLLPFPQMIVALAAYLAWQAWPRLPALVGSVAVVAVLFAVDLSVDVRYHNVLGDTGGWLSHSDAIYRLADYLEGRGVAEPMAMDWGIKTSVQIVTRGQVNPVELFQYTPQANDTFLNWLYGALTQRPETLYVFHADDATFFPRREAFEELAKKLDKKVTLEQTIDQRDGRPVFVVYAARS